MQKWCKISEYGTKRHVFAHAYGKSRIYENSFQIFSDDIINLYNLHSLVHSNGYVLTLDQMEVSFRYSYMIILSHNHPLTRLSSHTNSNWTQFIPSSHRVSATTQHRMVSIAIIKSTTQCLVWQNKEVRRVWQWFLIVKKLISKEHWFRNYCKYINICVAINILLLTFLLYLR